MIYCPKCGTANRDGSRFCNECGQTLGGPTRVRCARCGTMNPVQSAFCSECGGQLLSPSGEVPGSEAGPSIKGLSLPTKGSGDQSGPQGAEPESGSPEEEVPAWLLELGTVRASTESETASQGEDRAPMPDWLQDLRASFPAEEEAAIPPPPEEQGVPDWLARLRPIAEGQPPADVPESQEAEEVDVPDWLAQIHSPSGAGTSEPTAAPGAEGEDVPDWLAALHPQAKEGAPGPAVAEEEDGIPEWPAELRSTVGTEPPEPATPESETDEEEVPEWLTALPASVKAAEPALPEAEPDEGEVPDWLAQLSSMASEGAAEPVLPEAGADEEGIPGWLAQLRPAMADQVPETQEELPDWLAELRPVTTDKPSETEEELPGWLAELGPVATAAAPETEEEIPAWVAELGPAGSADAPGPEELPGGQAEEEAGEEEPSAPAWPPEIEEGEIPDWISAMRPKPAVTEEAPGAAAEGAPPEGEERPDWLVEVPSGEKAAGPEEIATAAMPDWLQPIEPAGPEAQASTRVDRDAGGDLPAWLVPAAMVADKESLARAEIPAWLLALKPAELREQSEPDESSELSFEPVEETGLLAGLHGTLPVEMLIAQPRAVAAAEAPAVISQDTPQARLFAEIVGRGPEAVPKVVPRPRQSQLNRVPLWITYLALLAAITLPLLLQEPLFSRSVEPPAWVDDLYKSVEALDPGRPVLVAFEYDPSSSDEMDVLAQTVVGHVFDRGVPVMAVSLQPAGPPVAQSVLEELAAGHPGARYANVGYISGQAAGVQLLDQGLDDSLLQEFEGLAPADLEIVRGVSGLDSFGLLLVLAAEPESLRIWIEQAGALQGASLAAAVSASTEPMARSYYETDPRQLLGLVTGVPGAASYESLQRGDDTLSVEMAARLDSLLAGHAVFIVVLVVGNIAYLVRRGPRGRR